MGTRSTIALECADGTVGQIYCHWDGYLEHNGQILFNHYQDPFKVRDLIDLGDMSALESEIGIKHEFGNPHPYYSVEWKMWQEIYKNQCTFYGRDRDSADSKARHFENFEDYVANGQIEEYNYILRRDGCWYVQYDDQGGKFVLLSDALASNPA